MRRFTASKTDIALGCAYWMRPDVALVTTTSAAAERGTRLHRYVEAALRRTRPMVADEDAAEWPVLEAWAGDLRTRAAAVWPEVPYALDLETGTCRTIGGKSARDYSELGDTEVAGTADVVYRNGHVTVVDLKTGFNEPAHAEEHGQLKTLGLMAARYYSADTVKVGIAHLTQGGVNETWATLESLDLDGHLGELRTALAPERIDAAEPTPGPHCTYCPAAASCPAQAKAIQVAGGLAERPVFDLSSPEGLARAWALRGALGSIDDAIKDAARAYVEEHGALPLLDGKRLRLIGGGKATERAPGIDALQKDAPDLLEEMRARGLVKAGTTSPALKASK